MGDEPAADKVEVFLAKNAGHHRCQSPGHGPRVGAAQRDREAANGWNPAFATRFRAPTTVGWTVLRTRTMHAIIVRTVGTELPSDSDLEAKTYANHPSKAVLIVGFRTDAAATPIGHAVADGQKTTARRNSISNHEF
jgi:hypothetical protein